MNGVFNHDAAAWARDVVMKMDEAEAEMFVRAVVHEALHWDISANRRTLNRHIAEVNKSIEADLNTLVSKSAAPVRELVSAVSKALGSDPYNRNEKGQFWPTEQRVRTGAKMRPLKSSQAKQRGIPDPTNAYGKPVKLTARQRADFQEQYLQLADAMDRFAATGVDNPHMILRDRSTGRQRAVPINPKKLDDGWDPSRVDLVAVRGVGRGGTTLPDASFDLVSALGGSPRVGNAAARGASGLQQGLPTFTERWTDASGDTKGTNERTYRRIQAGSQLLGDVAPGPKAQMASQFGQFVGQYGPEAEKVIGPKMRRTAYRYRGTERTPDKELISAHSYELRQAGITGQGQAPEQAAALGQKAAAAYLLKRLPNLQLAEIQRKSGKIPPSEGVIIDKDGKIVTQAVGFADDHYLPFNLKNLKNLKGGHYVRSRSMGGLTTEDIYTGLISGARSVSVVSNSGIFTIYFADDLRGARRHSDKANSMVERYAKTLDAIKEGQIERERLDPAIRAEIREEIESKYEGQSWVSRNEIEEEIAEEIKNYKSSPYLTKGELEQIEQHVARRRAQGTPENKIKRERNELIEAAMEKKTSRFYSLDGEGYAAAAEALKEQYPYFIENVNFMHRRGLLMEGERGDPNQPSDLQRRFKTGDDKGYVKARYNRPDEVLEGYFDTEIAGEGEEYGTGKTKASHTNYQNWEHNPVKTKGKLERKESESETEPEKPKTAASSAKEVRQQVARAQVARNQKQLASEAAAIAHRWATSNYPALEAARESFDSVWDDLTRRKDLIAELESAQAALARMDDDEAKADARALQSKITALRVESGRAGGMDYNPKEHMGVHASQPYAFEGDAYQPGASADQVRTEMARQLVKAKQVFGDVADLTQMNDRQLAEIGATAGRLSATMRAGTVDVEALSEMATILGSQNPDLGPLRVAEGEAEPVGALGEPEALVGLAHALHEAPAEARGADVGGGAELVLAAPGLGAEALGVRQPVLLHLVGEGDALRVVRAVRRAHAHGQVDGLGRGEHLAQGVEGGAAQLALPPRHHQRGLDAGEIARCPGCGELLARLLADEHQRVVARQGAPRKRGARGPVGLAFEVVEQRRIFVEIETERRVFRRLLTDRAGGEEHDRSRGRPDPGAARERRGHDARHLYAFFPALSPAPAAPPLPAGLRILCLARERRGFCPSCLGRRCTGDARIERRARLARPAAPRTRPARAGGRLPRATPCHRRRGPPCAHPAETRPRATRRRPTRRRGDRAAPGVPGPTTQRRGTAPAAPALARTWCPQELAHTLTVAAEHAVDGEVLGYAREAAQLYFDVLRRPEDAVGLLRRALSFAPDGKELKQRLAEGLRSAGELDEAQTLLSELVEAFGRRASEERAAVHLQLARVLHRKGDMDQAIENLEMASRMDHNDVTVLRTLAELSREGGQLDRAERAYRSLLLKLRRSSSSSLPPVSSDGEAPVSAAEVMLELGRIAADRGQADKAEELTASALDALAQDDGDAPR